MDLKNIFAEKWESLKPINVRQTIKDNTINNAPLSTEPIIFEGKEWELSKNIAKNITKAANFKDTDKSLPKIIFRSIKENYIGWLIDKTNVKWKTEKIKIFNGCGIYLKKNKELYLILLINGQINILDAKTINAIKKDDENFTEILEQSTNNYPIPIIFETEEEYNFFLENKFKKDLKLSGALF